jgi:hypothetical protein
MFVGLSQDYLTPLRAMLIHGPAAKPGNRPLRAGLPSHVEPVAGDRSEASQHAAHKGAGTSKNTTELGCAFQQLLCQNFSSEATSQGAGVGGSLEMSEAPGLRYV